MPEARVDARVAMFDSQTADSVLGPDPLDGKKVDFVIDAIDNVPTKVELLKRCVLGGVATITVTGAGAKADPTRLRVTSLGGSGSSRGDKLAKAVRHRLGRALREEGKKEGAAAAAAALEAAAAALPAVISDEIPRCGLVDVGEEGGEEETENAGESIAALRSRVGEGHPLIAAAMEEFRAVPGFRVRALPVLGPAPAAAGLAAAAFVLCHLAGQPLVPAPPEPRSAPHYQVLLDRLAEREEVLAAGAGRSGGGERGRASTPAVDVDDVAFLVREVWRGVSAVELCSSSSSSSSSSSLSSSNVPSVPGGECGLATATAKLTLCRWKQQQQQQQRGGGSSCCSSASVDNLVLLTFEEAEAHERGELVPKLDTGVAERIERALERVRREFCGPTKMTA
jgi:tRNA A37 threonylcarbamoyladenosine dehydratase